MANFDKILAGYPQSIGAKIEYVVDHAGPSSYTTGGETYSASNLNVGVLDKIEGGYSFSATAGGANATYSVSAFPISGSQGTEVTSMLIKWFSAGTEVGSGTNLNGQYVRLRILAA